MLLSRTLLPVEDGSPSYTESPSRAGMVSTPGTGRGALP